MFKIVAHGIASAFEPQTIDNSRTGDREGFTVPIQGPYTLLYMKQLMIRK